MRGERRDDLAVTVEHLGAQFALRGINVDKEVLALECYDPRRERAAFGAGVHRGEPVAAHGSQASVAVGVPEAIAERSAADIKIQLIANDQATAAHALHVAPVPGAFSLIGREEPAPIGTAPMETVAAETDQIIGTLLDSQLGTIAVRRSLPDAKQPQH